MWRLQTPPQDTTETWGYLEKAFSVEDCKRIIEWYTTEGHTYVDLLSCHELWLRQKNEYFVFQSDIDKNKSLWDYVKNNDSIYIIHEINKYL